LFAFASRAPFTLRLTLACMCVAAVQTPSLAQSTEEVEAWQPWHSCLVSKSRSLAGGPDSAHTIAEAAMALCRSFEPAVRIATQRSVEAKLVRDGVVSDAAEAHRIQQSVGDESWAEYLRGMTDQVAAIVVQIRAAPPPKPTSKDGGH